MRKLYRVSWYYRYEGTGDIVGGTEERIAWGSLSLDLTPTPPLPFIRLGSGCLHDRVIARDATLATCTQDVHKGKI